MKTNPVIRLRLSRAAAGALACWLAAGLSAPAAPIQIVAAESFYGDVARQVGGPEVTVFSIVTAPGQDPHQFEATVTAARAIAAADLVICNGANYDPWLDNLLAASKSPRRTVVVVADVVGANAGDNPHLWYDPATMPAVAARVAGVLQAIDPAHADAYARHLAVFRESLAPITAKIAAIKAKHAGAPVTATEPVFGPMAKALGLAVRNERFQLAVMNGTEPGARDLAAMQDDLRARRVRMLLYNSQVSDDLTERLLAIAYGAGIPVVGVTETAPANTSYQDWIAQQLDAVAKALDGGAS